MANGRIGKQGGGQAAYFFHQGTNYFASEYLGAHVTSRGWYRGTTFRVWAPHAEAVSVIGDWNGWSPEADPMTRVTEGGVWECSVSGVGSGSLYKYAIRTAGGELVEKSDPYAFTAELRPGTASRTCAMPKFRWEDSSWMKKRRARDPYACPMNIYELHAGSWHTSPDGAPLTYAELAGRLVPYLREMGYNYVELLPVCEYPLDDSWGYQTTGYFAPTSRYGSPADLMTLVNACHQAGIGVLLDWVPSHFPKNTDALARFDGEPCYEYRNPDKGEHKQWGTLVFDYGRNEVQSFLISSALFWLNTYHIDGLRVDAVASMLYLDYMRQPGEWTPNDRGGNDHAEAVAFLQKLNSVIREQVPDALMIAEESSDWGGVTSREGLGFSYKWNMGWMNDLLSYVQADPVYRGAMHDKLTFQLTYAFNENYILPISHDEVVHGKKSLLDKMPGSYEQKFAGLRLFLLYMYTQPGKKLMFMGQEFGQFIEWDYRKELDWFLVERYEPHRGLLRFSHDLSALYLRSPELWNDGGWSGFCWIDCKDVFGNTIVYRRIADGGRELIVVCNFSNTAHEDYRIGVPEKGLYRELLSSDSAIYGGSGISNGCVLSEDVPCHDLPQSVSVSVAPLSALVLQLTAPEDVPPEQPAPAFPAGDTWEWYLSLKSRLASPETDAASAGTSPEPEKPADKPRLDSSEGTDKPSAPKKPRRRKSADSGK